MKKRHSSAAGSVKGRKPEDGRMRPKHVVKERERERESELIEDNVAY
jgi:hypothetical protein